jgi:predicted dehydrogenase
MTRSSNRRHFLKTTGGAAAVGALAAAALPHVHAGENNTIQIVLVGCGGRGTGAAQNALSVKQAPLKLVAMADAFDYRLKTSHEALHRALGSKVDVPEDRRFVGFDAYRKAIDCLRPGDIAIFATPPAFRWVHFTYAIQKGVNVFMEKPIAVDGPTTRKMMALGQQAAAKNLKVGVGLMVRHCRSRQALHQQIADGRIGEIIALRAYRMHGPIVGYYGPKQPGADEVAFQVRQFHGFLWASGGTYSDFYIHQIDECCWMKGAWPVSAQANGGRHHRGNAVDQNFDNYTVEYAYPDGSSLFLFGRSMNGCADRFASYAHGTKGLGVISTAGHTPGRCRTYKGQAMVKKNLTWSFPQPETSPYDWEWEDLVDAVCHDKPYNEVQRGAEASLVTAMGRMAAHTGRVVTFQEMLDCSQEFAPSVDKLAFGGPAPLLPGPDGRYPVPQPGITTRREY